MDRERGRRREGMEGDKGMGDKVRVEREGEGKRERRKGRGG